MGRGRQPIFSFPEIGLGGAFFLGFIALVVGILAGTHWFWYEQIVLAVLVIAFLGYGAQDLEMGAIAYMIPMVAIVIGLIIGDISWALQTDAVLFKVPSGNPFTVD